MTKHTAASLDHKGSAAAMVKSQEKADHHMVAQHTMGNVPPTPSQEKGGEPKVHVSNKLED